MSSGNGTDKVL